MLEQELASAVTIAREAGEILLEIYATDFNVDFKGQGTGDPVTEADRRANALIVERLHGLFPDDGIVAEENQDHGTSLGRRRIWYVDPLDGTKEFVARNGEFSVMLGLSIDGQSQLGVVFQPCQAKLYRGVVGQGAYLEDKSGTCALQVSKVSATSELRLIVSRSHRSASTDQLRRALGIHQEASSGSVGLKVGLIAEQSADLYVHLSDKSSAWDTCGPEAVLRAAGGHFTELSGQPFVYGKSDLRTRHGILACNAAAFDAVLPAVRDVGRAAGLL